MTVSHWQRGHSQQQRLSQQALLTGRLPMA